MLVRHQVRRLERQDGLVVLDGRLRARAVVGADGANGVVRRQLGLARPAADTVAVAVRGYAPAPPGEPAQVIVMDGRGWPAYAWSFAAGDGTANVGFGMLLPRLREAQAVSGRSGRAELHGRLRELLPDVLGPGVEAERLVSHHLPLSTGRPHQPAGPVLLAGDAASLINPLTGEGIYYALHSGRLAGAAAVTESDPGTAYRQALQRELGRHLRHTTALARLTTRPGVVDAGVAAAGRSPGAFDALVEVGLGRGLVTAPLARAMAGEVGRAVGRRLSPVAAIGRLTAGGSAQLVGEDPALARDQPLDQRRQEPLDLAADERHGDADGAAHRPAAAALGRLEHALAADRAGRARGTTRSTCCGAARRRPAPRSRSGSPGRPSATCL